MKVDSEIIDLSKVNIVYLIMFPRMDPYVIGTDSYTIGMDFYLIGMDSYIIGMDPYVIGLEKHILMFTISLLDREKSLIIGV